MGMSVFVIERDGEQIDRALMSRPSAGADRYRALSPTERSTVCAMNVAYGKWLQSQATEFGYPWVPTQPWPTLPKRLRDAVRGQDPNTGASAGRAGPIPAPRPNGGRVSRDRSSRSGRDDSKILLLGTQSQQPQKECSSSPRLLRMLVVRPMTKTAISFDIASTQSRERKYIGLLVFRHFGQWMPWFAWLVAG